MKNKRVAHRSQRTKRKKARIIKKAGFWRGDPLKRFIKKEIRQTRPLHKKIILHPLSAMLMICGGVFISLWTNQVIANRQISATIETQPLNEGAIITSPPDNYVSSEKFITIHGTCPQDSYVKLYDNNIFSGVAWCKGDTFDIQLDLFVGKNVLVAQDYNYSNRLGPVTPAVTITYTVPNISSSSSSSAQILATKPPLLLTTDFSYQTFSAGEDFTWTITLEGGQYPYVFEIDWGDGITSRQVFNDDSTFTLMHQYEEPGYYTIIARASDAAGGTRMLQMATLVLGANSASLLSTQGGNRAYAASSNDKITDFMVNTKEWLWLAWPSFIIILLMTIAFRLGERQACITLKKKSLRYKHNAR